LRAGQVDRDGIVDRTNADAIKRTNPNMVMNPGVDIRGTGLYFGIAKNPTPWGDARVRQAVKFAIDYDGLIASATDGAASRTDWLGPAYADWGVRAAADLPKQDIIKAKQLLKEAGYPDGFKTTLQGEPTNRNLEPIAAMLKQAGIDARIQTMDKATAQSNLRTGNFEMGVAALTVESPDVDLNLYYMYRTGASHNYGQYSNPRVDELLDKQRIALAKTEERKQFVKEILSILDQEEPVVPLYLSYRYNVMQPWVKGWDNQADPTNQYAFHQIMNVWLDR
jgi:peptide/nickel transport system substrate-binding protein